MDTLRELQILPLLEHKMTQHVKTTSLDNIQFAEKYLYLFNFIHNYKEHSSTFPHSSDD